MQRNYFGFYQTLKMLPPANWLTGYIPAVALTGKLSNTKTKIICAPFELISDNNGSQFLTQG